MAAILSWPQCVNYLLRCAYIRDLTVVFNFFEWWYSVYKTYHWLCICFSFLFCFCLVFVFRHQPVWYLRLTNSLSSGRCGCDLKGFLTFNYNLVTDILNNSIRIVFRWMPQDHINNKSTLVQAMTWCHQPTSHYLSLLEPHPIYHMASLGHNELINARKLIIWTIYWGGLFGQETSCM